MKLPSIINSWMRRRRARPIYGSEKLESYPNSVNELVKRMLARSSNVKVDVDLTKKLLYESDLKAQPISQEESPVVNIKRYANTNSRR